MIVEKDNLLYIVNDDTLGVNVFSKSAEGLRFIKSHIWEDRKRTRLNNILSESKRVDMWAQKQNTLVILQEGIPRIVGCRHGNTVTLSLQDPRGEKTMEWQRGQKCPVALSAEDVHRIWDQTRLILRFQEIDRILRGMQVEERAKSLILSLAREGREEEIIEFVKSLPPASTVSLRLFIE